MYHRNDVAIRLEQKIGKIAKYALLKCGRMNVGWESSEFHAFKSLNSTLRGLLCANFIDYRLGDCGIWALLLRLAPQHYDIFFDSTAEWYVTAQCPVQAGAATQLKDYLNNSRIVVITRMGEILKEQESKTSDSTDYDIVELETESMCALLEWNDQIVRAQWDCLEFILDDLMKG
jgi:hypothetical protein